MNEHSQILLALFILSCFSVIIIAIVSANFKHCNIPEPFDNMMFPKATDADKTGDFETLQRECEPGLKKCMKPMNGGNGVTYWCSKTCINQPLNLVGTPIKEPMYWNTRFA